MIQTKPRGHTGPNGRLGDHTGDTTQLLTAFLLLITTLAQRQGNIHPPVTPTLKRTREESQTLSGHADRRARMASPSSPAPCVEDELRVCLDAFGKMKSIDSAAIDAAFDGLSSKGYTPDSLDVISVDRVAELTGFAEGKAAALMKFAQKWSAKMDQKREKVF